MIEYNKYLSDRDVIVVEKNIARHVLADALWITHGTRGAGEAKALYDNLRRSYLSRKLQWYAECLEDAWKQYCYWAKKGASYKPGRQMNFNPENITPPYPIRLEKRGRKEWEFAWPSDVLELNEVFEEAINYFDAGEITRAKRTLNGIIKACPYFVDAHNHLGLIEWKKCNWKKVISHYKKAYNICQSAIPGNFKGRLPWSWTDNRPFLRAIQGLALGHLRQGNINEALQLLERLLKLNPDDEQNVKLLLEDMKKGKLVWDD